MGEEIAGGAFDAVIHSAAVSDYLAAGVFAPTRGRLRPAQRPWQGDAPALTDRRREGQERRAGVVAAARARPEAGRPRPPRDWGFRGVLVKFKLEVGLSDES